MRKELRMIDANPKTLKMILTSFPVGYTVHRYIEIGPPRLRKSKRNNKKLNFETAITSQRADGSAIEEAKREMVIAVNIAKDFSMFLPRIFFFKQSLNHLVF